MRPQPPCFRTLIHIHRRAFSCSSSIEIKPSAGLVTASPNPNLVDTRHAPSDFQPSSAVVYESIITPDEGQSIVEDALSRMRRRRYEKGHWDAVITGYKEVELPEPSYGKQQPYATDGGLTPPLTETTSEIIKRIRKLLEANHFGRTSITSQEDSDREQSSSSTTKTVQWLPCHAIDLKKDGKLTAHVDSVRFSGLVVAGLSLLSPSIMRLKPSSDEDDCSEELQSTERMSRKATNKRTETSTENSSGHIDLFLPPLSLYVLSGVSRYRYTHELLPCGSTFTMADGSNIIVTRNQRLSIIFRDAKTT